MKIMPVYLLHIDPPYYHARHYVGYTSYPDHMQRVGAHLKNGKGRRSPLIKAAMAHGCTVVVARVWVDGNRDLEKKIKRRKQSAVFCPLCGKLDEDAKDAL